MLPVSITETARAAAVPPTNAPPLLHRNSLLFTPPCAQAIGAGAAARAAGSLGHVPKASLTDLEALYGRSTAVAAYQEARRAKEYVEGLIRDHQIACNLRVGHRFIAAHSPRAFSKQRNSLDKLRDSWGEVELIPRELQRREIGSAMPFSYSSVR